MDAAWRALCTFGQCEIHITSAYRDSALTSRRSSGLFWALFSFDVHPHGSELEMNPDCNSGF